MAEYTASQNEGEQSKRRVPRMRTTAKIVEEIKALDPGSDITEYFVRQLAKDGTIPVVWAGNKALINLDDVLELLRSGTARERTGIVPMNGIRRVDETRPYRMG